MAEKDGGICCYGSVVELYAKFQTLTGLLAGIESLNKQAADTAYAITKHQNFSMLNADELKNITTAKPETSSLYIAEQAAIAAAAEAQQKIDAENVPPTPSVEPAPVEPVEPITPTP